MENTERTIRVNDRKVKSILALQGRRLSDLYRGEHAVKFSRPTYYRLARGESFLSDHLVDLAEALGVNPVEIIETPGFDKVPA